MKNLFNPYNILLYFLSIASFFFIGMLYADLTDAAKDQGLAGGAIVLGYGIIFAFFSLVISIFIAHQSTRSKVVLLNKILALILLVFICYFTFNYFKNNKPNLNETALNTEKRPRLKATAPALDKPFSKLTPSNLASDFGSYKNYNEGYLGLGMFAPNLYKSNTLYLYGSPNIKKAVIEHIPSDSITFKQSQFGGFEIATAPPYLVPEHLKLDYDILYFRVKSIKYDFYEVVVNTQTGKSINIDKNSGEILFWPEFLLKVNSVEFLDSANKQIHDRPFEKSSFRQTTHRFMRPINIKQQWMYVEILNDDLKIVDNGWIKWHQDGKMLIKYSLLS